MCSLCLCVSQLCLQVSGRMFPGGPGSGAVRVPGACECACVCACPNAADTERASLCVSGQGTEAHEPGELSIWFPPRVAGDRGEVDDDYG